MTDIVERLRDRSWFIIGELPIRQEDDYMAMQEAADEIERLRAEVAELRAENDFVRRFGVIYAPQENDR